MAQISIIHYEDILGGYDLNSFEQIKISLIKPEIQKQISAKIQLSYKLRKESKELLEESKRKVEEEIEKKGKQERSSAKT